MTKINRPLEFDPTNIITLDVPRPGVTVGDLIEIVNYAFEETTTGYWETEVVERKDATFSIDGFEHNWTYSFTIRDFQNTEEGELHEINVNTIKLGIERLLNGDVPVANRILEDIRNNLAAGELAAVDNDAVDCIIQAGLFKELVYG